MSYTKNIKYDELCNYLDLSKDNSQKMLLNCINQDNHSVDHKINKGSVNGSQIIEISSVRNCKESEKSVNMIFCVIVKVSPFRRIHGKKTNNS